MEREKKSAEEREEKEKKTPAEFGTQCQQYRGNKLTIIEQQTGLK